MQRSSIDPDDHLASLPDVVRDDMATLDGQLSRAFSGHERVLWEGPMWGGTDQRIIGYGSYRYLDRRGNQVDWFVVGLASQKNYLSLYVNATEDGQALVQRYAGRLGKIKTGSANVTIKSLGDVELPALLEMVTRARDLMGDAGGN